MATSNKQRVGILIILVALVVGTLGSFAVLILSSKNSEADSKAYQEAEKQFEKNQEEYQAKVNAQAKDLSSKYYPIFQQYESRPSSFDKDGIEEIRKEDLLIGEGSEIDDQTKFSAYYIGWNSDGKIFDQSIQDGALITPIQVDGLETASLIEGWKEGIKGMKIGGVRELTIPSDLAYGEAGSGDDIPPNSPLKFVIMAVEQPAVIEQPEIPEELLEGLSL